MRKKIQFLSTLLKRGLLQFFFLCLVIPLFAAYLKDVPVTLVQPNGDTLHCYGTGDEFYKWLHDEKGFIIVQNVNTGYYVYSQLINDELVPTQYLPGQVDPASVGLIPNQNISNAKYLELRKKMDVPQLVDFKDSERNRGDMNNLVVFINFKDEEDIDHNFSSVEAMFNDSTSHESNSLYNYTKIASYNQLKITSHFYPTPEGEQVIVYQDSFPRSYYMPYSATNPSGYQNTSEYYERAYREQAMLKRACEYVEDMVSTSVDFDFNDDGRIDNVCFVIEGDVNGWSDLLWPHRWSMYYEDVYIHGKRVWDYIFMLANAEYYFTTATLSHETFHALSYPDLYRYQNDDINPVGPWDIMASTSTPAQQAVMYQKWKYGNWIDEIPELTEPGQYTIYCNQKYRENSIYKIPTSDPMEYIVMEYRRKEAPFDSEIPSSGILFYRVNEDIDGNASTQVGGCDEVYIFRKNGTPTWNGGVTYASFPLPPTMTEFSESSNPYPFFCDADVPYFEVNEFSMPNCDSMTFYFNNDPLSVKEHLSGEVLVTITPNPTTDDVQIVIKGEALLEEMNQQHLEYRVFDLYGREIDFGFVNNATTIISLKDRIAGAYFVQLTANSNLVKTFKVVKQ